MTRMGRWIQIGLFAALPVGTAFAQSGEPSTDTRSEAQKKAADTTDVVPSDVPSNPMNTPSDIDNQRNLGSDPNLDVNKAPSDVTPGASDINKDSSKSLGTDSDLN